MGDNSKNSGVHGNSSEWWVEDDPLDELRELKLRIVGEGTPVLDLSMINPDLPPPRLLLDRLMEASMKPANHRYAAARGIRKLREAFAHKYRAAFGVVLDAEEEVCVTSGAKDGLIDVLRCVASQIGGRKVLLPAPCYPAHLWALRLAGLSFEFFEVRADEARMASEISERLASGRFGALVFNFPHNPTGAVVSRAFYERLAPAIRDARCVAINDFVYGEMVFAQDAAASRAVSLLAVDELRDSAVEIYSMSKAYSVPGWRVAAVAGSAEIVRRVARLKAYVDYGIFMPLQLAAAAGLSAADDLPSSARNVYRQRARSLTQGLTRLGWTVEMPRAGASVWAKLPPQLAGRPSDELCKALLEHFAVVAMPGRVFGAAFTEYLRFALVLPESGLHETLVRLEEAGKMEKLVA